MKTFVQLSMSTDFPSFVLLKNIHTVVNIALQSDCQLFSYESPQSNCKIHPRKPTEKRREEERGARLLWLTGKQECISELRGWRWSDAGRPNWNYGTNS